KGTRTRRLQFMLLSCLLYKRLRVAQSVTKNWQGCSMTRSDSLPLKHCVDTAATTPPTIPRASTLPRPLPEQQQLLDEVAMSLGEISAGSNSKGILFTGPSGTGKTTA